MGPRAPLPMVAGPVPLPTSSAPEGSCQLWGAGRLLTPGSGVSANRRAGPAGTLPTRLSTWRDVPSGAGSSENTRDTLKYHMLLGAFWV